MIFLQINTKSRLNYVVILDYLKSIGWRICGGRIHFSRTRNQWRSKRWLYRIITYGCTKTRLFYTWSSKKKRSIIFSLNFVFNVYFNSYFLSFFLHIFVLFFTRNNISFFSLFFYFRLTLKLSCAMNFLIYPHDTQECKLQMESREWIFTNYLTYNLLNH